MLMVFIKVLGVYPPGTLVELSSGEVGMVMSANRQKSSAPTVILYDENTPRHKPMIVDLAKEEGVEIVRSLHASKVAPVVLAYLQPESRLGFFLGSFSSPV
jgi:hypothetical protein